MRRTSHLGTLSELILFSEERLRLLAGCWLELLFCHGVAIPALLGYMITVSHDYYAALIICRSCGVVAVAL